MAPTREPPIERHARKPQSFGKSNMAKSSKSKSDASQIESAETIDNDSAAEKRIVLRPLAELHLDPKNPRFGEMAGRFKTEAEILDFIVEQFSVQDVLSSIAVNGYFNSEPILVKNEGGSLIVAEGNRRLAACLILAGDPRAENQERRAEQFRKIHEEHGSKPFDPIPTITFETAAEIKELLPYLGVRHIAGAQEWDSFAKASWVAQAIESQGLELNDVIGMIGDETRLATRMLAGFYVTKQVVDEGAFNPEESQKRGTKSNPQFPFSWVYTALGNRAIAEYVGMPDRSALGKNPLSKDGVERAGQLFTWMFGQKDVPPAIGESREIGDLARVVGSKETLRLLRNGATVKAALKKTRPPATQLADSLQEAHDALTEVPPLIADGSVKTEDATESLPLSAKVKNLSTTIHRDLVNRAVGDDGDE